MKRAALVASIKRLWWVFILMAAVYGLLGYYIYRERQTLLSFQWTLQWGNLILSVIMHSVALGCLFMAWRIAIGQLVGPTSLGIDFRIYSLSILARRIPLPIWYVGSRFYFYRKEQISGAIALTASGMEIVLITISSVIAYGLLLPWYTYAQEWPWEILVALTAIFVLVLVVRPAFLVDIINMGLRWMKRPAIPTTLTRQTLLACGLLYLAAWLADGVGAYSMTAALLPNPPSLPNMIGIATLTGLIAIATMVLPAGLGLKEISMAAMLSAWMPVSAGLVFSILYRLMQTLVETVWAVFGQYKTPPTPPEVKDNPKEVLD